jgi:beta-lactamase superfamily II metal-dependent hydrolase
MIFTLEVLPAEEGDCLLLHWGTPVEPHVAVIDGGPRLVYEDALKPRLEEILDKRGLDQLDIEFVMVSHVDNDHITGIKKMFEQLKTEIEQNLEDRPFRVRHLWHNTFNDILRDGIDTYYKTFTASFVASVGGEPDATVVEKLASALEEREGADKETAQDEAYDIGLILAGHPEGRALRISHKFLYDRNQIAGLNRPFKKNENAALITAEQKSDPIQGLNIKVVGPLEAEIKALQDAFDTYIEEKGLTAEAVLAAYADTSVPNLSSIVCLMEYGGKRILFTGDARGDKILKGLEQANQFNDGILSVDVLKVPHHGSDRNVKPEFFKKIIAKTYVFSGNGDNGNPDRKTFEMLIGARDKDNDYELVLTYTVEEIDKEREAYAKRRHMAWNFDENSLTTLFKAKEQQGYMYKILAGAPSRVVLGDEDIAW